MVCYMEPDPASQPGIEETRHMCWQSMVFLSPCVSVIAGGAIYLTLSGSHIDSPRRTLHEENSPWRGDYCHWFMLWPDGTGQKRRIFQIENLSFNRSSYDSPAWDTTIIRKSLLIQSSNVKKNNGYTAGRMKKYLAVQLVTEENIRPIPFVPNFVPLPTN